MKSKILFSCLIFSCFVLTGCFSDPSEEELIKGEYIDVERMEGEVVEVGVNYFKGDQVHTKELLGKPYYWAKISYKNENDITQVEVFKGIPPEVKDVLSAGMKLPTTSLLTLTQLTKIEGEIIDMKSDLEKRKFFIVMKNLDGINVYRVDIKTYYTLVRIGTKLPLSVAEVDK